MEIYRIIDPMELDFKLEKIEIDYIPNTPLSLYLKDFGDVAIVSDFEEIDLSYIPTAEDCIFFTVNFGGKAAKIIIAIIIVIIIIIASIYSGGAVAAGAVGSGGTAGTTGGGVIVGAGGTVTGTVTGAGSSGVWSAASYAGSLYTPGSLAAASTGGVSMSGFLGNVALMAGSMLVSALLAPKPPSADDAPSERSAYLWGNDKTQSAQMIPIPIVLGTYPLNGNLIGTATEPRNLGDVSKPLYDVGSFIYGLCANQITDMHELYLDKLQVSEFADEDIAVFYTKGTQDQGFVKGFDSALSIKDNTYRFNSLDNEPLQVGEPVIPGLVSEILYNISFQEPNPATLETLIDSDYAFYTLEDGKYYTCEFNGICDSQGDPIGDDYGDLDQNTPLDSYIRVKCFQRTFSTNDDAFSGHAYTTSLGVLEVVEVLETFPYTIGDSFLTFNNTPDLDAVYVEGTIYTYPHVITTSYIGEVTRAFDGSHEGFILQISHIPNIEYTYLRGSSVSLTEKSYAELVTIEQEEGILDIFELDTAYDGGWETSTTSLDSVDFFKIQILAPGGLYLTIIEKEDSDDYFIWCSFEYEITRMNGGVEVATCILDSTPLLRTITTPEAWEGHSEDELMSEMLFCKKNIPVLGLVEMSKSQEMWSISSDDILGHPLATGTLKDEYAANSDTLVKGTYRIKMRINNRGICAKVFREYDPRGEHYGTFLNHGDHDEITRKLDHKMGHVRDHAYSSTLVFYRVKEYNLDETPNYSGVTNLGIVVNATEAFNSTLPQIAAICSNYIRTIDVELDPKIYSNWSETASSNPAFIILDLLWNNYYGAATGAADPLEIDSTVNRWARFLSLVDVDKFYEFANYCDEPVTIDGITLPTDLSSDVDKMDFVSVEGVWYPKRYVCNGVLSTTSPVIDWITKILGSYDATPIFKGSILSLHYELIIDPESFVPVQIFTNTNIIKDSFVQTFINPDVKAATIETTFMDEDNYYEKTPVIYMPQNQSYIDLKKKTSVNVFGLTSLPRVLNRLDQLLHKTNYLKQNIVFSTSMQGFTLRIGDMIGVTHEFIEWGSVVSDLGVVERPDDTIFTGRVVSTSVTGTTATMTLDRPITIDSVIMDLVGKFVYLQSSKTEAKLTALITGYNTPTIDDFVSGATTIDFEVAVEDLAPLTDVIPGSLYLLGHTVEVYKNIIINELTFNSTKTVKIGGVVFDTELYDYSTVYITDIAGNTFDKIDVTVRHLSAEYQEGYKGVEVRWLEPLVLLNPEVTLVEYVVYQKIIRNTLSVAGGTKWVEVYRTKEHGWVDLDDDWNSDSTRYYKVVPILKLSNTTVSVPLSWADEVNVDVFLSTDFIEAPQCTWRYSENAISDDLVDMHVFIKNFASYSTYYNETVLVWIRQSDSADTAWLGVQSITTVGASSRFASSIRVSDTKGLPKNASDNVFGLVILDDKDVVFVESDGTNTLTLKYSGINSAGRRFSLGFDHANGVSVKNAHLGFYNVKYFATIEDNGLESSRNSAGVMMDSLYSYDYVTKIVSKVLATDTTMLADLETISSGSAEYFRLTTGASDLISTPSQIGKAVNGGVTKLYIDTTVVGRNLDDLQINYAFKDASGYPYIINLVQLKESEYGDYPTAPCAKSWKSTSTYFTIPNLPTDKHVWIAITHSQIKEGESKHGFTSFPILIGE